MSEVLPFEGLLDSLEKIVIQIEKGDLSLENSLKFYEKGIGLVREAQGRLDKMEGKIEELMADGSKKTFEGEKTDDIPY